MDLDSKKISEILLKEGYVSKEDLKKAEDGAKRGKMSAVDFLLSEQIIDKDIFGQAMAEHFSVSYGDINSNPPSRDQVLRIPESIAKKFHCILFNENEKENVIATDTPDAPGLAEEMKKIFVGKTVKIVYGLAQDIDSAFIHYRKGLETRFGEIIKKQGRIAPELLDAIIEDAVSYRASDIHFEPQDEEAVVRFRIDGILHEAARMKKTFYDNILNRIKVQARLKIDEHYSTQDGAIRFMSNSKDKVDLRVSVVPTVEGEKVVMRVLSQYVQNLSLSNLGLKDVDQNRLEEAAHRPFGMILVTGPTGSGKTTTLYAALKLVNNPGINVTTIEDPVEYKISGINQIQVDPAHNITFADGLRAIVRQDPNVILVGEIRDEETAQIAVNAALTGHLLFSTFHANDSATAIPRLLDMKIEPFLLASTLELVMAQRLARRICEHCRYSLEITATDIKKKFPAAASYFTEKKFTAYAGKGCEACNNLGYHGRVALVEIIKITPKMRELILRHPSSDEIWRLAQAEGSVGLFEEGINKVRSGVTTLEEVMRVAAPKED